MGTGRVPTYVGLTAGLAAVVVALLANTSNPPSGQSASPGLRVPAALAGSPLTGSVRGAAAVDQISRLHGTRIEVADAVVARYGPITLWISNAPSPLKASALLWRMNRRMAGGTGVFSTPSPRELRGRTVFSTTGMGQSHAYYQSGATVLWLAAPPDVLDHALQDLLTHYP
ncbi:MAG TPA: hypothetical protein VNN19_06940 [bacterium]|nr:hypothetical protein [bacterium]